MADYRSSGVNPDLRASRSECQRFHLYRVMDFPTSATVLLCTHNTALAARWLGIERASLRVVCTEDSQEALERVLLDTELWLLAIDSRWDAAQAERLLQWLKRAQDERLRALPVLILADSLASSEWVPVLAEPVRAIWRSSGSEQLVQRLFESAAASGRTFTEITLEWQGKGRPLLPGFSQPGGLAPMPGLLRGNDRWQQVSDKQWTLRLDGHHEDVLAPLLRLSSHIRAAAAQDDAGVRSEAATGYFVAHLPGATYRLPVGLG